MKLLGLDGCQVVDGLVGPFVGQPVDSVHRVDLDLRGVSMTGLPGSSRAGRSARGGGDFARHRELRERWLGLDPIGLSPATINISAAVLAAAMNVTRTSGTSLTASRVVQRPPYGRAVICSQPDPGRLNCSRSSARAFTSTAQTDHGRVPGQDPRLPRPAVPRSSERCTTACRASFALRIAGHQRPRGQFPLGMPDTRRSSCGDSSPGCCPPPVSAPHHE